MKRLSPRVAATLGLGASLLLAAQVRAAEPPPGASPEAERRPAAPMSEVPAPSAPTPGAPALAGWQPAGDERVERRWYGWLSLSTATPGALVVAAAAERSSSELFLLGATGMALGPPIVHAAYGNWGKAVGALAMNVGLGTAGMFIGYGVMEDRERGLNVGAPIGLTVGVLTAVVFDAAFVAWDEPTPARAAPRRAPPRAAVLPAMQVAPGQASLGLLGAF